MELRDHFVGEFLVACHSKSLEDGFEWAFARVYGPTVDCSRILLWDEMSGSFRLFSWILGLHCHESMTEIKVSNTMAQSEDTFSHQSFGDLQNIQAAYRLNEKNYLKWSQFIRTYLKGKGKLSHLLGTELKEGDP
ncbi:hypothetical protein I3760_03G170300 [Carya illinoinensis]|nr:hypothetical protein I3760_03G170300 [Carya illinoinensis]